MASEAVEAATARFFGALSALRRGRIVHPRGVGFAGELTVTSPGVERRGVPLLDSPGRHRALVRCSRAAGLPEPLPDVLGLAVRLCDVHGPGAHQDFLLVTSGEGALVQHLLLPARAGFFGQPYSSLTPYRIGAHTRLVGARPLSSPAAGLRRDVPELVAAVAQGEARFELALASLRGRWRGFAELSLQERISDSETEAIRFNPWNTGGGIRPTGVLNALRDPAYRGSQEARSAREPD